MAKRRPPAQLDAEKLGPLLNEMMPVAGSGELPLTVLGYRNKLGRLCRVVADYANGWSVTLRLNAKMQVTSASAAFRLRTEIRGRD